MPLLRIFKDCFVSAAHDHEVPLHLTDLRDFLSDAQASGHSAYGLASAALLHFCVEDGRYNGNELGIQAVVRFLEKTTGQAANRQSLLDLKAVFDMPPVTSDGVEAWAKSNFPT